MNLEQLRTLTPDPARAARVRALCHARLAGAHRRSVRRDRVSGLGRRVLAPAFVLGVCALYVASLVGLAFRLRNPLE